MNLVIYFDCQLRNLLTVLFSMSRDIVLAISRLFSSRIYKAARFFTHLRESVVLLKRDTHLGSCNTVL